jgi:beta-N-acetylhexosaminidase
MALGPIMLDIEGLALSPADRDIMRRTAVGGVILFSRNYESPNQLADLVADIRALRSPPLLIAVDHEGGRVQRFREGFSRIPAMRHLGRYYDRESEEALALSRTCGWLIASELRAVGVDLCFAPCVDVDWGISDVIGDRSFHRDAAIVADLAGAFCMGLRSAGMAAVAKHFPGHGAVAADSHETLPVDRRSYGDVLDDIAPFEKLIQRRQIAAVMMAHVVYIEMDAAPAGFSASWIQRELRTRLGFDGAVFCDDLSMKATTGFGAIEERARLALQSGCDMVPVCNDRDAAKRAVSALDDFSNPLSLVRLARLHGTAATLRESLLASEEWQTASDRLREWQERPELELNA